MPSTPKINFNFINNNVESSVATDGVSIILARTTKGTALDPSTLIKSVTQFEREFGEEIVPDASVSNIEKALSGGSILRVIRVIGAGGSNGTVNGGAAVMTITLGDESKGFILTSGAGDAIGSGDTYTVQFYQTQNTIYCKVIDADGSTVLDTDQVITYKNTYTSDDGSVHNSSIDYLTLAQWISNNTYFTVSLSDGSNMESFLTKLAKADGTATNISVSFVAESTGTIGTTETAEPTADEWIDALEYIRDYTDAYNVVLSHLEQHLGSLSKAISVYSKLRTILDELNEFRGFIEIPAVNYTDNTVKDKDDIIADVDTIINTIGNSKWISYFTSGLVYNNSFGIAQNSEVLGTVLGLADASATSYGYHYSFAGVNRGIVSDAQGPVIPNYGSPGRVDDLEDFAQHYLNLFVIKDTPYYGKSTLLWHNFTSQVKQDSFRFLGVTGLVLNIKKTLRPILESYIEEPNYWATWKNMYLRIKPYIEDWVTDGAMTDPSWEGDQDATSWSDLVVNTEAEARQGHYKAKFSFKDIVALQDITLDVIIEASSNSVSVEVEE